MFWKEKWKTFQGKSLGDSKISPTPRQGVKETCSGKEQDCKEWGKHQEKRLKASLRRHT